MLVNEADGRVGEGVYAVAGELDGLARLIKNNRVEASELSLDHRAGQACFQEEEASWLFLSHFVKVFRDTPNVRVMPRILERS